MLYTSFVAVLLSLELVAQTPGQASSWVVTQSKEGGFSFSTPVKPIERSQEISGPAGKVTTKNYICQVQDSTFIVRQLTLPVPVPPNAVAAQLEAAKNSASRNLPKLVSEKKITSGNVAGLELVHTGPAGPDKRNQTVKLHLFIRGSNMCSLIVASGPDKPLPPETDRFLDSIRFEGQPAAMSRVPAPAKPAAITVKRKPLAKIDLVNKTPEDALRTFMMATAVADEQTLRTVTLANPDLDLLLTGEPPPFPGTRELKQQMQKMKIERLKVGDQVTLPENKVHVIRATEVGQDRAALLPEDAPVYTQLRRVNGHWKVDARQIIALRKAADAARQ